MTHKKALSNQPVVPIVPVTPPSEITNIFTLEQLFTIPLKAVIDANAYAAKTALDFIIRYGFNSGLPGLPEGDRFLGNLRMAKFVYNFPDENGYPKIMEINIPVLSLIPIPMLEVKRAQFDFAIQILSEDYREERTESFTTMNDGKRSLLAIMSPIDTTIKENSNIALNRSLKANMTVKIDVEKSDLPAGILQLLNVGQEAIRGKSDRPPVISIKQAELIFNDGNPKQLEIQITKTQGTTIEYLDNIEVMIEVTSSFGRITELFSQPIKVAQGIVIGESSHKSAIAQTVSSAKIPGGVKFLLQKRVEANEDVNGFIIVRANGAPDKLVYFSFSQNKLTI